VMVYVRLAGSPAMAVAGPVLVTARSATAWAVVLTVELLLPEVGSVVLLLTVAVFFSAAPSSTLGLTCAITVKLAEAPAASVAMVSLMLLPLPPGVKAGPLVWL